MGNSGSVHNLNINGVRSELNSYYQPQMMHLRRSSKKQKHATNVASADHHRTHSLPHMSGGGGNNIVFDYEASSLAQIAQFKVLPQLNEQLKLRTTTNGAILLSGGTISGRKVDTRCVDGGDELPPVMEQQQHLPMQRARTFIYASPTDGSRQRRTAPLFRRAKTLLNLSYSSDATGGLPTYAPSPDFQSATTSKNSHATEAKLKATDSPVAPMISIKSNKLNKYNKKRKAPAAPFAADAPIDKSKIPDNAARVCTLAAAGGGSPSKAIPSTTSTASQATMEQQRSSLVRPRLFRTNVKSTYALPLQCQQESQQKSPLPPLLRRNSLNSSHRNKTQRSAAVDATSSVAVKASKLPPYRRAKSSDAILLRAQQQQQRQLNPPNITSNESLLYDSRYQDQQPNSENSQHLTRPSALGGSGNASYPHVEITNEIKKQATKITKLKRTFYFGMNSTNAAINDNSAAILSPPQQQQVKHLQQERSENDEKRELLLRRSVVDIDCATASGDQATTAFAAVEDSHSSERNCTEEIDDNGLLVHVRPTLPRRQLETPSFSPAAAWLRLVEEQQFLHQKRNTKTLLGTGSTNEKSANGKSKMVQKISQRTRNMTTSKEVSMGGKINRESDLSTDNLSRNLRLNLIMANKAPMQLRTTLVDGQRLSEIKTAVKTTSAIAANKTSSSAWTPQQDLDEDDDEDEEEQVKNTESIRSPHYSSSECHAKKGKQNIAECHNNKTFNTPPVQFDSAMPAVHVFSLSLPRDAHVPANMKYISNKRIDKVIGFSSLQKLKCTVSNKETSLSNEYAHNRSSAEANELIAHESGALEDTTTHCGTSYRSDNWVLHKTRDAASGFGVAPVKSPKSVNAKWDTLATMEPISLSYLTGGKHVMYLPGHHKTNVENKTCSTSEKQVTPLTQKPNTACELRNLPISIQQQRQRKKVTRENLQDIAIPAPISALLSKSRYRPKHQDNVHQASNVKPSVSDQTPSAAPGYDKPMRFSFQSTVRLLEKRRLAIKVSRDAEFKESQRKNELEAMKRVEEDFQRKRALEKANIRQQMQLFCSESGEGGGNNELYNSLPIISTSQKQDPYAIDSNNNFNIYFRAEPDGAVSSPSPIFPFTEELPKNRFHINSTRTKHLDFSDCGESDIEAEMANLMRTTSLVEPYLQSIIK